MSEQELKRPKPQDWMWKAAEEICAQPSCPEGIEADEANFAYIISKHCPDALTRPSVAAGQDVGVEVSLDECPPGLFWFNGTLGFMSEYSTIPDRHPGFRQRDAYVVESGEYFWGGVSNPIERGKLKVRPVDAATLSGRASGGEK